MKRNAIKSLSCDAIDSKPIDADWTEGFGETWESWEASRCEECNAIVLGGAGERHCDVADDNGDYPECTGHISETEGPMMNYWYPIAIDDVSEAARAIVDLPLCVVEVNGVRGLALTGGGMDLTWQIAEAFMLLGYLPPSHFAGLPAMCGRGISARDRWIAAGCIRSAVIASRWALGKARETRRALVFGRDHEAKRAAERRGEASR